VIGLHFGIKSCLRGFDAVLRFSGELIGEGDKSSPADSYFHQLQQEETSISKLISLIQVGLHHCSAETLHVIRDGTDLPKCSLICILDSVTINRNM